MRSEKELHCGHQAAPSRGLPGPPKSPTSWPTQTAVEAIRSREFGGVTALPIWRAFAFVAEHDVPGREGHAAFHFVRLQHPELAVVHGRGAVLE
jgi:hypothetical protein